MDVPGDTLTLKGTVTGKRVEGGERLVELDIWMENGKGEKTTPGQAMVALPSRG
jgi:acyl dehydratase